jgi:CRP/FNR family transcriptional regulator, cyclic AMP receptor protein
MHIHQSGPALSEMTERFKPIPFLQNFDEPHLKQLLGVSRMLVYDPEELIIPEGAFGDRLYVLLNGKVRVTKNRSPITVLDQVGDVFGELSLLGNETRTASVHALETTWCLELSPGFLQKLSPPERETCQALLYRSIARIVAERLRKTTDELVLAVKDLEMTRRKLAELRRHADRDARNAFDDELELAIEQLRRTKEKLSRLGRTDDASPAP